MIKVFVFFTKFNFYDYTQFFIMFTEEYKINMELVKNFFYELQCLRIHFQFMLQKLFLISDVDYFSLNLMYKYGVFSSPYFPVFRLNIQTKFLHSGIFLKTLVSERVYFSENVTASYKKNAVFKISVLRFQNFCVS